MYGGPGTAALFAALQDSGSDIQGDVGGGGGWLPESWGKLLGRRVRAGQGFSLHICLEWVLCPWSQRQASPGAARLGTRMKTGRGTGDGVQVPEGGLGSLFSRVTMDG